MKNCIDHIVTCAQRLSKLYEDQDGAKSAEIQAIGGTVFPSPISFQFHIVAVHSTGNPIFLKHFSPYTLQYSFSFFLSFFLFFFSKNTNLILHKFFFLLFLFLSHSLSLPFPFLSSFPPSPSSIHPCSLTRPRSSSRAPSARSTAASAT